MKKAPKLFLNTLRLQNFATFKNQEITFDSSFNALVGETGSGKSLILDALQLIMGQRADKKLIRKKAPFAVIEATLTPDSDALAKYFEDICHPYSYEIVIKRIIYPSGSSKSFLNYQSCQLSTLTLFAKNYIDLVGQFENQKLLSENYQMVLLDSFAKISSKTVQYKKLYNEIQEIKKELTNLNEQKLLKAQREDYLRFQIFEIESLGPSKEDEDNLLSKKEQILGLQQKKDTLQSLLGSLSENDNTNTLETLKKSISKLESMPDENHFKAEKEKLYEAYQLLEEVSFSISSELEKTQNSNQLDEIMDRLDLYQKLKRKFGGSSESVLDFYQQFTQELNGLKDLNTKIVDAQKKIEQLKNSALELSEDIHALRLKNAQVLSKNLTIDVRNLQMKEATLEINVNRLDYLTPMGISKIEFLAETNPGEGMHPIKDIASGGELSRILLSLRQVLSSNDSISIFLFDEIDAGVGGETALSIGAALKKVSKNSQVIAITHLPQIAHHADKLIHVYKYSTDSATEKRTYSQIKEIAKNQKDQHVKSMNPIH